MDGVAIAVYRKASESLPRWTYSLLWAAGSRWIREAQGPIDVATGEAYPCPAVRVEVEMMTMMITEFLINSSKQ